MKPTLNTKLIILTFVLFIISYFAFYNSALAIRLETGLPNIPDNRLAPGQEFPQYIRYLFLFGLSLIAFLALARMMIGGIQYILAAGNVAKVEDAKDTIQQALLGLGLLIASVLILRTINPDLVSLNPPQLGTVTINAPSQTSCLPMSCPASCKKDPCPKQGDVWDQMLCSCGVRYPVVGEPCSKSGDVSVGGLLCTGSPLQWTSSY